MTGDEALVLSKTYVKQSLEGVGALSGKPCQIQSITKEDSISTVTFLWQDNSGTEHTSEMKVSDGADGNNGVAIAGVTIEASNRLIVLYSDGTSEVAGTVRTVKGDQGESGYSPTISENANNSDSVYKLDITDVNGSYTTPNLKGTDGMGGGTDVEAETENIDFSKTPWS